MGITGLLPFLEKASKRSHISEFKGYTVAIDSYCWLHKGAFACADKIARGETTDIHIQFCLKYVNMLLSHNIKPILVFDGRHLPAKALTENKRRESRKAAKTRAAELLRLGKTDEARSFLRRCVDITHDMALQLIQECRKRNIDCIVAPYEADAQMAYLNQQGIAQLVITEDSDLTLFGCNKILFKLDLHGNCVFFEAEKLHLTMGIRPERFRFEKFRHMCILSGCDYLDSLPGIGLVKACKFVNKTEDPDIYRALLRIPGYLNMKNLIVTDEYRDGFLKADATFRHMLVYDPLKRELVRLTDPEVAGTNPEFCCNAGDVFDSDIAFQLALGNLDPFSLKKMDDWNPDRTSDKPTGGKTSGWSQKSIAPHSSIWRNGFQLTQPPAKRNPRKIDFGISAGKKAFIDTKALRRSRTNSIDDNENESGVSIAELASLYGSVAPPNKKQCTASANCIVTIENPNSLSSSICDEDSINEETTCKSPTKLLKNPFAKTITEEQIKRSPIKRNPFAKSLLSPQDSNTPDKMILENPEMTSPILISSYKNKTLIQTLQSPVKDFDNCFKNKPIKKLSKFERTAVAEKQVVISKFFNGKHTKKLNSSEKCSPRKTKLIEHENLAYSSDDSPNSTNEKLRRSFNTVEINKQISFSKRIHYLDKNNEDNEKNFNKNKKITRSCLLRSFSSCTDIINAAFNDETIINDDSPCNIVIINEVKTDESSKNSKNDDASNDSAIAVDIPSSSQSDLSTYVLPDAFSLPLSNTINDDTVRKTLSQPDMRNNKIAAKTKQKLPSCRRPGLAKQKSQPNSTQSRLSMFGFQRKPQLKH